jgi:hypothetical protein
MTLLSLEIVDALVDGREPAGLTMTKAMKPFSVEWNQQTFQSATNEVLPE